MRRAPAVALAIAAYVVGVPLVAVVLFLPMMIVAGPHSDLLPQPLQTMVVLLCWLAVFVLPAIGAKRFHRRLRANAPPEST